MAASARTTDSGHAVGPPPAPSDARTAPLFRSNAAGAFLVSASCADGRVGKVTVFSEAGSLLRIINPWRDGARLIRDGNESSRQERIIEIPTKPDETIVLLPEK